MKIDTNKIENYENMTAEEKLAAVLAMDVDETSDIERYKNAASKANSEAAAFKKTAKDYEGRIAELEKKIAESEKDKRIATLKASYLKIGFPDDLAGKTAEAYVNGDDATVFANHAAVNEARDKDRQAASLKSMPRPEAGAVDKTMTLEQFRSLSVEERAKFATEHADEYKTLYGGT